MRYLDIAVAAAIGVLSTSVVLAWSPTPFEASSRLAAQDADLRSLLVSFVSQRGLVWLQDSSFSALCAALSSSSNSTVTLSAESGGNECDLPPTGGYAYANVTLPMRNGEVDLEAWEGASQ